MSLIKQLQNFLPNHFKAIHFENNITGKENSPIRILSEFNKETSLPKSSLKK